MLGELDKDGPARQAFQEVWHPLGPAARGVHNTGRIKSSSRFDQKARMVFNYTRSTVL
jgi:hypothetical protein